jgi:spore photoproduct lyase
LFSPKFIPFVLDIYDKKEYNTHQNCGIWLIKHTNGVDEQIISSLHIRTKAQELIMTDLSLFENFSPGYQPVPAPNFDPNKIIITKGSYQTKQQRSLAKAICSVYPKAGVIEKLDVPHNRIQLNSSDPLELHYAGKKTLVFGIHKSALRYSDEDGNTCPNYWHFSPYGFCPYDCQYCYLAGTPGVKYSPTVKIFLNLSEILNQIDKVDSKLDKTTSFYLGKLQDGLALDPITGYSRMMIPFFARQRYARLILLTKSVNVENLLDLDHKQNTILSWSLNPPEVSSAFERNVPSPDERIAAIQKCNKAGYPVRAVIMPIIPIDGWQNVYSKFLENLLKSTPLNRITLGQICSYCAALQLTERKLGKINPISNRLEKMKSNDGRVRFPLKLRIQIYNYLIDTIKKFQPQLPIGLCMEEHQIFEALNLQSAIGYCNCVL